MISARKVECRVRLSVLAFLFITLCLPHVGTAQLIGHQSVVNIISGAPLTSHHDSVGGYGDVASNLTMALELKERYPKATINFLVTSETQRRVPDVPTTRELMFNMIPELSTELTGTAQVWRGINFIFIETDYTRLTKLETLSPKDLAYLKSIIPISDMSLQFSANNSAALAALRINSKLSFSFNELGGGKVLFNGSSESTENFSHYFKAKTGAGSMGYYLVKDTLSSKEHLDIINKWAHETGQSPLLPNEKILFAYSKMAEATQVYVQALTKVVDPATPYLFYVKDFNNIRLDLLPPNVRVVKVKSFPHEVMQALIHEAVVAPLVTGDVSLSLALSFLREDRNFVYETLVGKKEHIMELFQKALPHISVSQRVQYMKTTGALMLDGKALAPHELAKTVEKLTQALLDVESQRLVSRHLMEVRNQLDVLENIEHFISWNKRFHLDLPIDGEMLSGLLSNWMASGGAKRVEEYSKKVIANAESFNLDKVTASITLLLMDSKLSHTDKVNALTSLSANNPWEYETIKLLRESQSFHNLLRFGLESEVQGLKTWVEKVIKMHSLKLSPIDSPSNDSSMQCSALLS